MFALLQVVWRFLSEFVLFLLVGKTWTTQIAKIASYAAVLAFGIKLDEAVRIRCSLASGFLIETSVTVGAVFFWAVVIAWICLALGVAWARFFGRVVYLGEEVEPDQDQAIYRLRVTVAFGSAYPAVYAMEVVDAKGKAVTATSRLPLELEGTHYPEERQGIFSDVGGTVSVVQVQMRMPAPCIALRGMRHAEAIEPQVPWQAKQKVWIRVHVAEAIGNTDRWISFWPDAAVGVFNAGVEIPPYLTAQESRLSRYRAACKKFAERITQEARRFIERIEQRRRQ